MAELRVQIHSHLGIGFAEEKGTEKEGEVSEGVCSRSSHFMEAILFFVNHKSARIM